MFIKNFRCSSRIFKEFQRIVWNNLKCVLTLFWSHCEIRGPPLIWGPILGGRHQFWDPLWGAPLITGPVIGVINFGSILKACHLLCVNAYFRTTLSGNGLQFGSFGSSRTTTTTTTTKVYETTTVFTKSARQNFSSLSQDQGKIFVLLFKALLWQHLFFLNIDHKLNFLRFFFFKLRKKCPTVVQSWEIGNFQVDEIFSLLFFFIIFDVIRIAKPDQHLQSVWFPHFF